MLSSEVSSRDDASQQNTSQSYICNSDPQQQLNQQQISLGTGCNVPRMRNTSANLTSMANNALDRVRNALHSVSNCVSTSSIPPPPPPPTIPALRQTPTLASIPRLPSPTRIKDTNAPKIKRRGRKKREEPTLNAVVANPAQSNVTSRTSIVTPASNVVVKNRFKHSRPVLAGHNTPDKRQKTGLEQISDGYTVNPSMHGNQAFFPRPPASTITSSSVPLTDGQTLIPAPIRPSVLLPSPVQTVQNCTGSSPWQQLNTTPISLCPCFKSSETTYIGSSCYKCNTCNKTYMPVHKIKQSAGTNPSNFYGTPQLSSPANMLKPIPSTQPAKKRGNKGTTRNNTKKKKQAETIDLVSSDEEERQKLNTPDTSAASSTTPTSSVTSSSSSPAAESNQIADRMRLPGGALPDRANTPTPPLQPSPSPSPGPSETPAGEYKFHCNKAMFGELYGHALAPTRVAENRMYLSLECIIYRNDQPISEKYTLSVGQNDVQRIMVYFGRVPSFVAIETAQRFSEVACRRIGRTVLVPGSEDPKKRHIILALVSAFKNDSEAAVELGHLISCVSPWARIDLITLDEAELIISQVNLDVNQKELCYGKPLKPTGPVETLLIYPFPPKANGIPVTSEDVACLAEGIYLNDIIIDFYLKYLFESILTSSQRERTYMFNSYFYKRLTQKQSTKSSPDQMHAQVKKWTRNVDIFEKDFIVIPVNEHCHWYLVVICFPGKPFLNAEELNEKDEEEEEDDSADFVKETNPEEENTSPKSGSNEDKEKLTSVDKDQGPIEKSDGDNIVTVPDKEEGEEEQEPRVNSQVENSTESVSGESATCNPQMDTLNTEKAFSANEPAASSEEKKSSEEANDTQPQDVIKEKIVYTQAYELDEFTRPCILIFDSLVGSGHSRVFTNLRHYLTQEWTSRKSTKATKMFDKTTMKGCYPKIPRQNNDCDCGVFLLQYVESFFTQSVKSFRMPVHLENWFTLEFVSQKREQIKNLISDLADTYKKKR